MGKKGKNFAPADDEYEVAGDDDDGLDQLLQFAGTAKSSKAEKEVDEDDEEPSPSQSAGKKKNKSKDDDDSSKQKVEDDLDEAPVLRFTGKKKKKSKSSKVVREEEEALKQTHDSDDKSDKQKVDEDFEKNKNKNSKVVREEEDEEKKKLELDENEDEELLQFPERKKKKKGKKAIPDALANEEAVDADDVVPVPVSEPPVAVPDPAPKKNEVKKKKAKNNKADLDDELSELLNEIETSGKQDKKGGSKGKPRLDVVEPSAAKVEEVTSDQVPEQQEPVVESAAEKKKKKKKEKEKAAKASSAATASDSAAAPAAAPKEETKKPGGKLPPKHVREKLEQLAKLKEEEERRKREEEERIRKEEQERERLEKLEREKEEIKKRRKEREKEKLRQKKAEGKILTSKQKEEQKRLALQREQILAQKGGLVDVATEEAPRKPKYETKKPKRTTETPATEAAAASVEEAPPTPTPEVEVEAEPTNEEESNEVQEVEELEEEEEEEDWDAKSWEDDDVQLPLKKNPFDGEDEEEEEDETPSKAELVSRASFKKQGEQETESKPVEQTVAAAPVSPNQKMEPGALRSPICCILGHVDTGKTKLLDCIRRTNVQEGEAGGITQQIGATYFPKENIRERTKLLKEDANLRVPGLLVIDTPGHESFTNLRARGSSLCDIAILVIDIMHGLEQQTIESLNLLRMRKTPLVVALNKVDRIYAWNSIPNGPIRPSLKAQAEHTVDEFHSRVKMVMTQLQEQGMNSELYWKNKDLKRYTNIVPTSAISGEGIPDLLLLLVQLTQKMMESQLTFKEDLQCTVLEVKVVEGLGTTIDVVLVNGILHEGDQIIVCGMQGPIVTVIRALLTPHPMKELRVKGSYLHHKELKAAQGIKITAQGLEHAIAGTQLYVVGPEDDLETLKAEAMQDMNSVMNRIDKSGEGVCVQASTLGSLEALLDFLKSDDVKIPVSGINIGPVHKKDIIRASIMLEKKKEYATILAFDVKVNPEAKELADELGVRIFTADIIYHLFDQFTAYMKDVRDEKRTNSAGEAVFPCILKILPGCVFNQKDPLILGVEVSEGIAKVGTPLCVPRKGFISLGKIASLEHNHKVVDVAKTGEQVAVKIVGTSTEESQKMFGRHFDGDDELVSQVSRRSIDILKENFRDEVTKDEWRLIMKLKQLFQIQ